MYCHDCNEEESACGYFLNHKNERFCLGSRIKYGMPKIIDLGRSYNSKDEEEDAEHVEQKYGEHKYILYAYDGWIFDIFHHYEDNPELIINIVGYDNLFNNYNNNVFTPYIMDKISKINWNIDNV
jgi:hypothetical protein